MPWGRPHVGLHGGAKPIDLRVEGLIEKGSAFRPWRIHHHLIDGGDNAREERFGEKEDAFCRLAVVKRDIVREGSSEITTQQHTRTPLGLLGRRLA